jgi:hypothetical protein
MKKVWPDLLKIMLEAVTFLYSKYGKDNAGMAL